MWPPAAGGIRLRRLPTPETGRNHWPRHVVVRLSPDLVALQHRAVGGVRVVGIHLGVDRRTRPKRPGDTAVRRHVAGVATVRRPLTLTT
jgi:hypothetical protein